MWFVKAYGHWEVGAWEDGTAVGDVTVLGLCERWRHCVSTGACMAEPPGFCPPHVCGERLSRLLSHSPAFSSPALGTCRNNPCKTHALTPHTLTPSGLMVRHGRGDHGDHKDTALWHKPVGSLSCLLLLLLLPSHLGVVEGRKLWKGRHHPHGLFLTFSNPDECV